MSRVIVFVIGVIWASLLLFSWGNPSDFQNQPAASSPVVEQRAS